MDVVNSIDLVLGYFDPGSGSLLLQVIVGGSAGLLVFARYLWDLTLVRRRQTEAAVRAEGT